MIIIKFAFELIVIFRIQSGEIYMFIDRMEIIKKCFDVRFAGVFSKHHYLRCTLKQSLLYHGCIFEPLQLNFHKHSQVGSCSFHKRQRLYFNSSFLLNVFTKKKKKKRFLCEKLFIFLKIICFSGRAIVGNIGLWQAKKKLMFLHIKLHAFYSLISLATNMYGYVHFTYLFKNIPRSRKKYYKWNLMLVKFHSEFPTCTWETDMQQNKCRNKSTSVRSWNQLKSWHLQ